MTINILYFASLREKIGCGSDTLDLSESLSVAQVWQQATGQESFPNDVLVALNQEYTDADAMVSDGDEIAFFPPVTGG
ncbi:MAG: molybdopterin converting factor subunit 1 [Cocleimonas sp.]|nr:molybdopterin converting factor subunit 1 [Cocleimonas sp.]